MEVRCNCLIGSSEVLRVRLRPAIFPAHMRAQASCALVALAVLVLRISAWTDATCSAKYPNYLPYACTFGSGAACGGKCGYGPTYAGTVSCCGSPPPTCAALDISLYTDCSSNSLCHTAWANYGSCTGCGAAGVQKQTQPCKTGATGPPNSRTVSVTCGSIFTTCISSI